MKRMQVNGDPIEPKLLEKWFKKWQKAQSDAYPEIVFHGIRHSSITCKLYLSEGDYKAVQGDSGHFVATMITDNYAHLQDSRRFALAQKLEKSFYNPKTIDKNEVGEVNEAVLMDLAEQLQKNPESLNKLLAALSMVKQ